MAEHVVESLKHKSARLNSKNNLLTEWSKNSLQIRKKS